MSLFCILASVDLHEGVLPKGLPFIKNIVRSFEGFFFNFQAKLLQFFFQLFSVHGKTYKNITN